MAAIQWTELRGQKFTPDEAREASDFVEILRNFGFGDEDGLERAYNLFKSRGDLTPAKRLVFAETVSIDKATVLLLCDSDDRIRAVVDERLKEHRGEENGGIIIATH